MFCQMAPPSRCEYLQIESHVVPKQVRLIHRSAIQMQYKML